MFKFLTPGHKHYQHRVEHSLEFFHICVSGMTGSGKTHYLLHLLRTEFFKKFNCIILICPTYQKNQTYLSFEADKHFYVIPDPVEKLEENIVLARSEASKYNRSLIIFDDIVGTKVLNNRTSKYVQLLIGSRHDGISTITLTQQLNSISKPARDQFTRLDSFYNANAEDRKIMFDTYLVDTTKEERSKIIHHLRTKDYGKISINVLKGTYRLL